MSGFAALMALSASQTKQVQSAVQTALEQRERNEQLKRKKRDEEERKVREEEAKLRQRRFEDQKKQEALEARREADLARLEAEQTRREEEARNVLLYGPKKAKNHQHHGGPKWPTSQSGIKDELRRQRLGDADADEAGGVAFTREEKRQRRVEADMRRMYQPKRGLSTGGYSKAGRRLPGGAIDAPSLAPAGASAQSVKARLAALPNTLTKLNVNKRDTRTIDEILQDRARAKNATLDGDDAREFNDWFGKAKKKEPTSLAGTHSSASLASGSSSGGDSPRPGGTRAASLVAKSQPVTFKTSSLSRPALSTKPSTLTIPKVSSPALKPSQSKSPVHYLTKSATTSVPSSRPSAKAPPKKRLRSASRSVSPPPAKRRVSEPDNAFSSEIWKLFGKDRHSYMSRNVLSDDEDMEADVSAVMNEEMRSARLAKREDEMALEEEKRHEEEKRRRRRERERQGL